MFGIHPKEGIACKAMAWCVLLFWLCLCVNIAILHTAAAQGSPLPSAAPTIKPTTRSPTILPTTSAEPTSTRNLKATLTFEYTGHVQNWTVPQVGLASFRVDAYGAEGAGAEASGDSAGGLGGYISLNNIRATPFIGKVLYVYVGGKGARFNGGGSGRGVYGGGATDMRTSCGELASRLVVAGGGQGGSSHGGGGGGGGVIYNSAFPVTPAPRMRILWPSKESGMVIT